MNKRKKSKMFLFLTICVFSYFFYTIFVYQSNILKVKNEKIKELHAKIEEQKAIGKKLNAYKDSLESDEYVEKIAREKLHMLKSNEKVFVDVNK